MLDACQHLQRSCIVAVKREREAPHITGIIKIYKSSTEKLGHYIDLPKITQPIHQQLCDSMTVEMAQNSPKIGIE